MYLDFGSEEDTMDNDASCSAQMIYLLHPPLLVFVHLPPTTIHSTALRDYNSPVPR